jgi:hypothetical protein
VAPARRWRAATRLRRVNETVRVAVSTTRFHLRSRTSGPRALPRARRADRVAGRWR